MAQHPVFKLPVSDDAALLLTPCPGTKEASLSDSMQQLCYQNSPALITMMTEAELAAADVADLAKVAVKFDMQWFHLPIEDDSVPGQAWEEQFQSYLPRFKQLLSNGMNLTLHCKGGSGRTGLVAARILLALGKDLDESIAQIKALRPNAFTAPGQLEYVKQFAN